MSQTHRVIILNQPLKITLLSFDFTVIQWVLMFFAVLAGAFIAFQVPKDWKFDKMPVAVLVFILLFCISIALVKMSQIKPWIWWRNLLLYRLKAVPTVYMPNPEEAPVYPDPTIIDVKSRSDDVSIDLG